MANLKTTTVAGKLSVIGRVETGALTVGSKTVTGISDTISNDSTQLATAKAVYDYVTKIAGENTVTDGAYSVTSSNSITSPSVNISLSANGFTKSSSATSYYVTVTGTGTNGSVTSIAEAKITTAGYLSAGSKTGTDTDAITPSIIGSGDKLYIPAAVLGSEGSVSTAPSVTIGGTTNMSTATSGTYYFTRTGTASNGTVQTKYKATTAGYTPTVSATNGGTVTVTPTKTADATVYIPTAKGSVTMTKGSGSTSATGTNLTLGSKTTTKPSGIYITSTGSGSVSATAKITTAGYTPTNTSFATGSSTSSNSATAYYPVTGATIPSGGSFSVASSSGTLTTTSSLKVKGELYHNGSKFSAGSGEYNDSLMGNSCTWFGPSQCIITKTMFLAKNGSGTIDLSSYGYGSFTGEMVISSDRLYFACYVRAQSSKSGNQTANASGSAISSPISSDSKIYQPTAGIGSAFQSGNTTVSIAGHTITIKHADSYSARINVMITGTFSKRRKDTIYKSNGTDIINISALSS